MNRRGFLSGIFAAGAAPAIVRADSLMKIFVPPEKKVIPFARLPDHNTLNELIIATRRQSANSSIEALVGQRALISQLLLSTKHYDGTSTQEDFFVRAKRMASKRERPSTLLGPNGEIARFL